ncbi:M23 family metallopeptidase [Bacillus sp. DX4.1]|uniref:M23 family metallopeptidase n=1 Tax=Bacillus sp. DX4.1 TaxID=3055867 RepID=UPI0025A2215A|nr:M23 family metallopeptidase [Bacillus sp. DX4.1]MDM5188124.1 M23 family metallopeptidase [Bacillus sp. DX4.1]
MWKKVVLILLATVLLIGWGSVFLVGGIVAVFAWWMMQAFSLFGVVILMVSLIIIIFQLIKRRRVSQLTSAICILSIIVAWPCGWFIGIGQMAYPADIHSTTPKATIRLPINQPVLVGWGGDRLETNYHAMAPIERWAYDLLIPPAGIKSSKLEDYGIFGVEVVAPASGTVVSVNNVEADLIPGTDNYKSMAGNHVYIRLDETGTYLMIAHLKKDSVRVKVGQHIQEGIVIAQVGNSGSSSEPHLHIHHQRQDPSKTSIFLSEGLPLYFRDIDGPAMPEGGIRVKNGDEVPVGDIISPVS